MVERLILDDLVHWAINYKVIVYIIHWCSLFNLLDLCDFETVSVY